MSENETIILNIYCHLGIYKLKINSSQTTANLFEKVCELLEPKFFAFALFQLKDKKEEIKISVSRTIFDIGLIHDDCVFVESTQGKSFTSSIKVPSRVRLREDVIDMKLSRIDGQIRRKRVATLCNHNDNSVCFHCLPLEPYDETYLREYKIKHMSYHAYLRKLTLDAHREGKFPKLDDPIFRVNSGCKTHPPWPPDMCSACKPSDFMLSRQTYKHVDDVQFENLKLVEQFLYYWRVTHLQRAGFLYGCYEVHTDLPLGIRAIVKAIYEPPQENNQDFVTVLPDDHEEVVNQIANGLGMRRIGYIFTHLVPENLQQGTVKHTRHEGTHFLTTQECITSAMFQSLHPNPSKISPNGCHGSKFFTVCVTGDKNNQVHLQGYQVSNQCMNLVRDNCLIPFLNHPELGYIRDPSEEQYVPDVYFKKKDFYGMNVLAMARPFPNEYLLVDIPVLMASTSQNTFNNNISKDLFPIENRKIIGLAPTVNDLVSYFDQFTSDQFFEAINDFHLLIFLATLEVLPMKDYMVPLLKAIKDKNVAAALEWSKSMYWAAVETLLTTTRNNNAAIVLKASREHLL